MQPSVKFLVLLPCGSRDLSAHLAFTTLDVNRTNLTVARPRTTNETLLAGMGGRRPRPQGLNRGRALQSEVFIQER